MSKIKRQSIIHFWGIGAHKSGTSWLFSNLQRLPGFTLPPIKELHYFDRSPDYPSPNKLTEPFLRKRIQQKLYLQNALKKIKTALIKEKNWRDALFYFKWYFSTYNDKWYLSLFNIYNGIRGEVTPSYSILSKEDVTKMYNLSPDTKLILIFRNPIDRAWSHYRHTKRYKKHFSLERVTNDEIIEFIESEGQLLRSDYISMINNYSMVFPKNQILICFYDEIIANPEGLLEKITIFINGYPHPSIKDLNLKRYFNKSIEVDCPEEIYNYLKNKYHNQIKILASEYGGYFSKWYTHIYEKSGTSSSPNEEKYLLK